MIFSIDDHVHKIVGNQKTQTRRQSGRYKIDRLYAIQPGRGKKGIDDGKIFILDKKKETKQVFEGPPFYKRWMEHEVGYPISQLDAEAEGDYTPEEYEALYEKTYPNWTERWVYYFTFCTKEVIEKFSNHVCT